MHGAYMNKYLSINLTTREISQGELDSQLAENYVGGKGMGLKLLSDLAPQSRPPYHQRTC